MSQQNQAASNSVEIAEVREATFDPEVGETVLLAVRVIASGTRVAASDQEVIFTIQPKPEQVRVKTEDNGWAVLPYTADQAGDVAVTATLETGQSKNASHTFRFKALTTGVWGSAKIQLNTDENITTWGEETKFPRTSQAHTIKLSADEGSHLRGREICLGLTGYSSPSELGITSVQPALGVFRALTTTGLSWLVTGTIGGAYGLRLEASRILKQSPDNAMSLGPVPPDEISDAS